MNSNIEEKLNNGKVIFQKCIPAKEAEYTNFPESLNIEIIKVLKNMKIEKLYTHQKEMFELAEKGDNVVITTSTASGKTLSFLLPVINEILENPLTRAIFIYPTKALASDQYRAMKPFLDFFGQDKINAGVYDGDTSVDERRKIRASSNIILTNPDMLNTSFLPNHSKYNNNFIFANLKYVVIDELHTYKGAFGSHISNVFKRLNRICKYYNSNPQFLCSSATIANPQELAQNVCGKEFSLVYKNGAPSPQKKYEFIQPKFYKGTDVKKNVAEVAKELIPQLVLQEKSFICFCKSRRTVETVLKESRMTLEGDDLEKKDYTYLISGYRGGYTPIERKQIEKRMISGQLKGLISTNALELGIDIGAIDSTVLIGYPNTVASFLQQSGRAGRKGKESTTYLILDDLPRDQYIANNPGWIFNTKSESAVLDANNLYIQLQHIRAASAELALSLDDIAYFEKLSEIIPILLKAKEVKKENGSFTWCGNVFPAGDISLRNIDNIRYQMINKLTNESIEEFDELQAFRNCHKQSIYLHDNEIYMVEELNKTLRKIFVVPKVLNYYTVPWCQSEIQKLNELKSIKYYNTKFYYGDIRKTEFIVGHKKIQFNNYQNLGFEESNEELEKTFDTEAIWIEIPLNVCRLYNKLTPKTKTEKDRAYYNTYYDGISYTIKNAASILTMADENDIDTHVDVKESVIYIYDNYPGGLGFSKKLYGLYENIIKEAISLLRKCSCKDGCPACVGDYHLDKKVVLWGLENMLEIKEDITTNKVAAFNYSETNKPFKINNLKEQWNEFLKMLSENGEKYYGFLSNITKIDITDNIINISVDNEFEKEWIEEDANINEIKNIFNYYVESKKRIEVVVNVE